jgi:hypothetical protein
MQKAMASAKKDTKDRSTQWKKDKAKNLKPLILLLYNLNKMIVLVKKMRMNRTKRLL